MSPTHNPAANKELRKFRRSLLLIVLIPTAIAFALGGYILLHERAARITAQNKANNLENKRASRAEDLASGTICRGNLNKSYLRYRAQHLTTDSNRDIARRLYQILDPATQEPLSDKDQRDFIRIVIHSASVPGPNVVRVYGCTFKI